MQTRRILSILLSASLLIGGCASRPGTAPSPETSETAENTDQERFEQIIDDLFYDTVTSSGLMMHSTLSHPENYSLQGIKDNYADLLDSYKELQSIDRNALSPDLQNDYDILTTYLETEKEGEPFSLYDYPFSSISGMQVELPIILAEYSFRNQEDVDHYLALLADLDECYSQLLEYVQLQTEAGIFLSDLTIDGIIDSIWTNRKKA